MKEIFVTVRYRAVPEHLLDRAGQRSPCQQCAFVAPAPTCQVMVPPPVACLQCCFVVRVGCGAFERVRCKRDFPLLGVACPGRCSTPGGVPAPLVEEV